VISLKHIRKFLENHPDAGVKPGRWYKWMKKGIYNPETAC
jgi:hypothetical protein